MANYSRAERKKFLSITYFGTTNSPDDDVNPHNDLRQFLADRVGNLRWGASADVRNRSKQRFADTYHHLLDYYHVKLSYRDVLTEVLKDGQKNETAVNKWLKKATFPPKP